MKHRRLHGLLMTGLFLVAGVQVQALDEVNGVYHVANAQDLVDFAKVVNNGKSGARAVLMEDIDLSGVDMPCIQTYSGTFDGQGHTINNFTFSVTGANQGFFGTLMGATIQNFSITGTIDAPFGPSGTIGYADNGSVIRNVHCGVDVNVNNNSHCGGLVGSLRNAWVDGCTYSGTLTIVHDKGDSNGGIAGYTNVGLITNNLFSGKVIITQTGNNAGGILGYVNNADFKGLHGNLCTGSVEGGTSSKIAAVLGHANNSTPTTTLTGNYWLEGTANAGMNGGHAVETPSVTAAQLASGEITFKLNAHNDTPVWFQQIGKDPVPVRTGNAIVYETGIYNCDGTPAGELTYSNTPTEAVHTPHDFDKDGFCTVCGFLKQAEDGYYEISSAKALRWVGTQVEEGNVPLDIRLTADLDLSGEAWTPIGNDSHNYSGNVDGAGHTITGMTVNHSEPGAGLFGTVFSGTFRDLTIDAGCSVTGVKYAGGLIGHSTGSGSVVYIERVAVHCDVTCTGEAAAGLIGNANAGSVCHISECCTTGSISAAMDAACFSGWLGNVGASVKNSWTTSQVSGIQDEDHYLARYSGTLNLTGCYSLYGTQGTSIEDEDVSGGRLAYLLNGSSFIDPIWFQTIGSDPYPVSDNTHGVVYYAGNDAYASITDEASFVTFRQATVTVELAFAQETVACKALLDAYAAQVQQMSAIEERDAFIAAYVALMEQRREVEASAAAYDAYSKLCIQTQEYLLANPIAGPLREKLETYLDEELEPGSEFTNGSYPYIMANHLLNNEELAAEQAFVQELLKQAIAADYVAGSEVTSLMQNPLFENQTEGWETTCSSTLGFATVEGVMPAVEGWNCTFDVHQTLTGLKPGIYMLQANAAFRAGGDIYNPLHVAQIYLNDNVNYVMMESEDYISKDQAVDGENCHLTGSATDYSYILGDAEGYVPMGPIGCAYAFKGERYVNRVAVEITDGTLTVGIRNQGTGMERDWTGFGQFRLFFLGSAEEASTALDNVLADCANRATTILGFTSSMAEDYAKYPNFSKALQDELTAAIAAIPATTEGAAKLELAERFSQLFVEVYACRQAYIEMVATAESIYTIIQAMVDQGLVTEEERDAVLIDYNAAWSAFVEGTASLAEAQELTKKLNSSSLYPPFEDGYYLLSSTRDWQIFAMMVNAGASRVNARLCADLDFEGVDFMPIGWNVEDDCVGANESYVFRGTFDGGGHTISNVVVNKPNAIGAGIFGSISSPATIHDLRVDATCSILGKDRAGLVGRSTSGGEVWLQRLGNEATVSAEIAAAGILGNANNGSIAHLSDCYSTGSIVQSTGEGSFKNCAQLCGWFGSVGATVDNCWSISPVSGHDGMDKVFARQNNNLTVFTNCYSTLGDGSQARLIPSEVVLSGELTYNLNAGQTEEPVWRQTLGEDGDSHPVLDATHLVVFKAEDGTYYNDKGGSVIADVDALQKGPVRVFDTNGRFLRAASSPSRALEGLPRGLYILKGTKGAGRRILK